MSVDREHLLFVEPYSENHSIARFELLVTQQQLILIACSTRIKIIWRIRNIGRDALHFSTGFLL
jgi:hypothetical protein